MTACYCGAQWTGLALAHCSKCHVTFTSTRWFDRHITNRGGHVHPADLRDKKGARILHKNKYGYWGRPTGNPVDSDQTCADDNG